MKLSLTRHSGESRSRKASEANLLSWFAKLKEIPASAGVTVVGVALLVSSCSPQPDKPEQTNLPTIVSINPCTDAILGEIADHAQILAISHYSRDPRATSMPLEQALNFAATSGSVEEVIALKPDLVVAGGHVGPATVDALKRLDIKLVQTGVANSVEESEAEIRNVAEAIGRADEGEALIKRITDALARNAPDAAETPVPALVWQGGGLVPGKGTLIDDLLSRTGFTNVAEARGLAMWDVLGLEYLVDNPPRVLLSSKGSAAQEDRMLDHPALTRLDGEMQFARFDQNLIFCGGPTIIRATDRLAEIRAGVK